ncbi:MAG: hypothetical protein J3Q66DRAFT_399235 [Benniella sp.]|nr:MAG: hypothetical protein J3Q66DRAFT_399235 [Benniella sp.]
MAVITANRAAAAIATLCFLHILFYQTTSPVLTITATALLFLPVYARRLQVPVRHPFKTITYYVIWAQITYSTIWNAFLEVSVVIGLFLYARRALNKPSVTTLDSEACIESIDHEANPSLTSNKDSETAPEDKEIHSKQMDPTLSTHVDMSQSQSESPKPVMVIKSWPFKAVAVLIGYVGLLALVENYFNNTRRLVPHYRMESGTRRIHPFLRGLSDQAHYAIVLVAIQGYITLPSGSFKLAAASLLGCVNWVYAGIYLLPVNLSLLGMFAMTEHLMVYPYLMLVWDILFSTGLHYGIASIYAWYLYRVVVQDGITLDPLPKLHIADDNPDVVGIDIADLSSFTHTAEMVFEDDQASPYDGRFNK